MPAPLHHPVYDRLISPCSPVMRHALLHDLECQVAQIAHDSGLAARVRHFIALGVPRFAPADATYRDWAAKAARLWDELHQLLPSEVEPALV